MAAYERVNYADVEPVSGAMRSLTESLGSEQVGVSFVRCEPGWRNEPHDHVSDDHEEVYVLLEGESTVVVDDDSVSMKPGDAVWIPPRATRQIRTSETDSAFVLISAPASQCRTTTCTNDVDSWSADGFVG